LAIFLRKQFFLILISTLALAHFASGEGTRTWEQSKFEDLSKGSAVGVAIRSMGGLELAPAFKAISTTPSTYIWSIAADPGGNLYAATGSPARVYRITPQGESSTIFEPKELQVQALALDKNGILYAATNPDGKVYRIERQAGAPAAKEKKETDKSNSSSDFSASVFFDPGTKYIWDLVFDNSGNLYVATGDHGEIFRVTPKGEHSVFFKSDEAHIRVLAVDVKGNLIAGSDGSGLVYQIKPSGEGFVLYSAPKKEITALAIDKAGNIYAAGVGEKRPGAIPSIFPPPMTTPAPVPTAGAVQPGMVVLNVNPSPSAMVSSIPLPGSGASGGSEIYRIAPDGSPSRLWASRDDLVYALAFDPAGRLLAGTGNRGHIFAITGEDRFVDLLKASATQVTAFAEAPAGGLYVSTSNLGKVFLLGSPESEGSYESDVFDGKVFSRWGRAELRGAGQVELFARSGNVDNPDRNWSPWTPVNLQKDPVLNVPPARFIQWKAVLHAGSTAPSVDSVLLNYLPKNVAPDFDEVSVQVGVRYQPLPKPLAIPDASGAATGIPQLHFDAPPPTTRDSDSIGVKWTVHDDNDDQMVYSVFYRGDGEARWLMLKDNLTDKYYSFDAALLPDGGYTVEVMASDAPSHSPGQALTSTRDSARFEVDTTPPRIEDLKASNEGTQIHVSFRATDGFSNIKRAEYSVDAADWQYVEPIGQLADSKSVSYDFQVAVPSVGNARLMNANKMSSEHVVVVRVYDRFDNMSSAKTVIRGK
jgi:sugar lactone lactonase YvrE